MVVGDASSTIIGSEGVRACGDVSAVPRLSLGCPSAVSRLSLDCLSTVSRLSLDCLSVVSRLSLGCPSAASRLSLGYLSAASRLSLDCLSARLPREVLRERERHRQLLLLAEVGNLAPGHQKLLIINY